MKEKFDIVNGYNEEEAKFVIESIENVINNRDKKEINSYINQILFNIKKLLRECNRDTIAYIIIRLLNKFIANAPNVRVDLCEKFDNDLVDYINNIEYEKYVLKELKKYLKYCSRSCEYDNLDLTFEILISIIILYKDRRNKLVNSVDVWECGIKNIDYIPVANNDKTGELKESIDSNLNILRRKK